MDESGPSVLGEVAWPRVAKDITASSAQDGVDLTRQHPTDQHARFAELVTRTDRPFIERIVRRASHLDEGAVVDVAGWVVRTAPVYLAFVDSGPIEPTSPRVTQLVAEAVADETRLVIADQLAGLLPSWLLSLLNEAAAHTITRRLVVVVERPPIPGADGVYDARAGVIYVKPGLDDPRILEVVVHELGHALDPSKLRNGEELAEWWAECLARMILVVEPSTWAELEPILIDATRAARGRVQTLQGPDRLPGPGLASIVAFACLNLAGPT